MRIRHVTTLAYYDGPVVFEARDTIGGHYIAVTGRSRGIRYLVAGVAPSALRAFREGEIDLRHLLLESDPDCRYTTTSLPGACNDELEVERFEEPLEENGFLPDPGFVMERLPSSDLVGHAGDNRLVLSLDESAGNIGARAYTELILQIQALVRRVLTNIKGKGDEWSWRDGVFDVVVPAAPGSFRVVLGTSGRQNRRFNTRMSDALHRVDGLFQHSGDPEQVLNAAVKNGVDVAYAYLKLLQLLIKNRTGLSYAWAGREVQLSGGSVSRRQAVTLEETLTHQISRQITLEGRLYRCNSGTGFWGLKTHAGKRRGRSIRPLGPDLSGLQLGEYYRFTCNAKLMVATKSETLHLTRCEKLPERRST